jgi:hypothetical protein
MGLIRGSLLVIVSVLLFIMLLLTTSFSVLNSSLEYENIKPELVSITESIAEEYNLKEIINETLPFMEIYCENNSEFVFKSEEIGETFVIPCEVVNEGPDAIISKSVENFVDTFYYKEYSCEFFDCFKEKETPFFLISKKSKDYWNGKFYTGLIFSVILVILMFFIISNKTTLPILVGGLLILSALPFLKIEWLFSVIGNLVGIFSFIGELLKFLFSEAYSASIILIILGVVSILLGIFLKLFKAGFKISNFINKFSSKKNLNNIKKKKSKK